MPIFRCMESVSHRRTPQSTEVVHYFSVFCGALRWLFIHVKIALSYRFSLVEVAIGAGAFFRYLSYHA